MPEFDYDVVYIGSGHGTFDGAMPLAAKGKRVAVIEADKVGELVQTGDVMQRSC